MQYFSKRFDSSQSDLMKEFNSSIYFDHILYQEDIEGSLAHIKVLEKANILTDKEVLIIEKELIKLKEEIKDGKIQFSDEYEDIHMNIEKILTDRIGDLGKKIHTGRSRNDQVALDMKLYVRKELIEVKKLCKDLLKEIVNKAKENVKTYMPVFTHLQKAQVSTYAHYILAYAEMLKRDIWKIENTIEILNYCPLGAAALTGSSYNLDRNISSEILGFKRPTSNSLDSVSDRDYLIDALYVFSLIMMHLSRLAEENIVYSSQEFSYVELSDEYSTGSSIMPQKKNPDSFELIRGKAGRVYGHLISMLTTMKALALAYNKDMQEDKEGLFDSINSIKACLKISIGAIKTLKINKERLKNACYNGYIEATDIADYLTKKGVSFRTSYQIVGTMVKDAIKEASTFNNWSIEKFKKYSEEFEEDIFYYIDLETMVNSRKTIGSPNEKNVLEHIKELEKEI